MIISVSRYGIHVPLMAIPHAIAIYPFNVLPGSDVLRIYVFSNIMEFLVLGEPNHMQIMHLQQAYKDTIFCSHFLYIIQTKIQV